MQHDTRIEYKTAAGCLVSFPYSAKHVQHDIERACSIYYNATFSLPELIILSPAAMSDLTKVVYNHLYVSNPFAAGAHVARYMCSFGVVEVKVVKDAYVPLFVGTFQEYHDSNMDKLFEEIVLGAET